MKRIDILKVLKDKNVSLKEKYTLVIKHKRKCSVDWMIDLSEDNSLKIVAFARKELKRFIKSQKDFCIDRWCRLYSEKGLQL
jgi:hypothetical protein